MSETVAAVLTAPGRGAIAVVRVWGSRARDAANAVFRPNRGRSLAETPSGRPRVGRVGEGLGDEVVAVVLDGDEPEVEIHCHGGAAATELVLDALRGAGATVVPASAWVASRPVARVTAGVVVGHLPSCLSPTFSPAFRSPRRA